MFNSDLERELSEESAPVNNGKMIATQHLFWKSLLGQSYTYTLPYGMTTCKKKNYVYLCINTHIMSKLQLIIRNKEIWIIFGRDNLFFREGKPIFFYIIGNIFLCVHIKYTYIYIYIYANHPKYYQLPFGMIKNSR
jgi:hypothetical protein